MGPLHWLMVHLSQETGTSSSTSRAYNFFSGFGSDLSELALLGGVITAVRSRNCHRRGCWRVGHPVGGSHLLACHRHHPGHPGDSRNLAPAEFDQLVAA